MKITEEWLNKEDACSDGVKWFVAQTETDGLEVVKKLIADNKLDWANWLIVRIMTYEQYVSYAVYAAEQVIDTYEQQYPNDKRPRLAIAAAKKCIKNPNKEKRAAARAAAGSAREAAMAAEAAWAAAEAAWAAAMLKKILAYGIKLLEAR